MNSDHLSVNIGFEILVKDIIILMFYFLCSILLKNKSFISKIEMGFNGSFLSLLLQS